MGSFKQNFHHSLIILVVVILTGCSVKNQQPSTGSLSSLSSSENAGYIYKNASFAYETVIPSDFADQKGDDNEKYFGYANDSITGDVLISIYTEEASSNSCSPNVTGVKQPIELPNTGGKTFWGKVDYFDSPDSINGGVYPQPVCQPPEISWAMDDQGNLTGPGKDRGEAYVLCAEKDEKRVLICMTQQTDNPSLAKQIFESFRWVDEK